MSIIADKRANGGRRRGAPAALKSLGEHPDGGGEVTVNEGRYGPYVKWGKINATIPKGKDPQSVTMEEAVPLLAARAEKAGLKKPAKKKAPAKKTATKKTTTKTASATKKASASKKKKADDAEAEKSDS
nr:topoisomerase C-terminal repeat-containing protein [Marinicella sp. W31]MDC2878062.1 topoisomerase C-terminal repeat-containing protein [Marinicella sp. W31]